MSDTTGNSILDMHHATETLEARYGLTKGSRYVVQLHASGYTNAEYIGFGGFRLADDSTVFPTPGHVRDIASYVP